jgi:hypothetical protein
MSSLSKPLVRALLRVVQTPQERYAASKALARFAADYRIGRTKGAGLLFSPEDKGQIRDLLRADGIDPHTKPECWDGLSRADSLLLARNEKFSSAPVKRRRVAIKSLADRPLCLIDQRLVLPPGWHLDVDGATAAGLLRHATALLVENWESFDRIHETTLDLGVAGDNPLVIWRGDRTETRADHALALLLSLDVPVWAFVDFDPAGLIIAASLPRLAGIIAPSPGQLARDLARGLPERYQAQLPAAGAKLDALESGPVRALWEIIRRHGRALPQEYYLRPHP